MEHRVDDTEELKAIARNLGFLKTILSHNLVISRSIFVVWGRQKTLRAPTHHPARDARVFSRYYALWGRF